MGVLRVRRSSSSSSSSQQQQWPGARLLNALTEASQLLTVIKAEILPLLVQKSHWYSSRNLTAINAAKTLDPGSNAGEEGN